MNNKKPFGVFVYMLGVLWTSPVFAQPATPSPIKVSKAQLTVPNQIALQVTPSPSGSSWVLPLLTGCLPLFGVWLGSFLNRRGTELQERKKAQAASRDYLRDYYLKAGSEEALISIIRVRNRFYEQANNSFLKNGVRADDVQIEYQPFFRVCEILKIKQPWVLVGSLDGLARGMTLPPPKGKIGMVFDQQFLDTLLMQFQLINTLLADWSRKEEFSFDDVLADEKVQKVVKDVNALIEETTAGVEEAHKPRFL